MIKSRSNSSNANVMVNVSVIKASSVSTIYVARGKRAGIFEILCAVFVFILSAFVILGPLAGFLIFLAIALLTLTSGILTLVFAWKKSYLSAVHAEFIWMIVSIGISLVILILVCVGVGFSFECLIDLGGLCNLIARAVLVAVFTAAYFTLKTLSFYNVFLMRREVTRNHSILFEKPFDAKLVPPRRSIDEFSVSEDLSNEDEGTVSERQEEEELKQSLVDPVQQNREIAIKRFNVKPKRGIEFLLESKLIEDTGERGAQQAVDFILEAGDKISRFKLGDYLGESDTFPTLFRNNFANRINFYQVEIDHALRMFLTKFVLPRETEKIDRVMSSFAHKFYLDNPNLFKNEDTAYILSFSLIMLHTDAHNPNVKEKFSKDGWIHNNDKIDDGKDLPYEYLSQLYDRIVAEEIMFSNVDKRGWLLKHARNAGGGPAKPWKRHWFVLSDNCLYYYVDPADRSFRGMIPLEGVQIAKATHVSKPHCILLYDPTTANLKSAKLKSNGQLERGVHEFFLLSCSSEKERGEWLEALQRNVSRDPFYDIIKTKLAKMDKKKFGTTSKSTATTKRSRTASVSEKRPDGYGRDRKLTDATFSPPSNKSSRRNLIDESNVKRISIDAGSYQDSKLINLEVSPRKIDYDKDEYEDSEVIKQVKIKTERSHKKEKSSDATPKTTSKDSQRALMDSFKKESILERVDDQSGVSPREEKSNPAKSSGHKRKISITNTFLSEGIKIDGDLPIEPVEIKEMPVTLPTVAANEIEQNNAGSDSEKKMPLTDSEHIRQDILEIKKELSSLSGSDIDSSSD